MHKYILLSLLTTSLCATTLEPSEHPLVVMVVDVGAKEEVEALFVKETSTPRTDTAKTPLHVLSPITHIMSPITNVSSPITPKK